MIISEEKYLKHYGILRKSGRYPWGSGENPGQRSQSFFDIRDDLRSKGLTDSEIAKGFGMTTTQLRNTGTLAKAERTAARVAQAQQFKEKGMSNQAIAERMGLAGESSVRALLEPSQLDKANVLRASTKMLEDQIAEKTYIDVGTGVERHIGVSRNELDTAIAALKDKGYELHTVQVDQLGTNNKTLVKVLTPPGTTYTEVKRNLDKIQQPYVISTDNGRSYTAIQPPLSISSKRLAINYAEDGGSKADGVIYVRPGVPDVSLGGSRYAQVRIAVDDTHFIKGMAMYKDDLPKGVDLVFNTNKSNTGNKLDALKPLKDDPDNPFGSAVSQIFKKDAHGKETQELASVMNLVNEEGNWSNWSKNLSSQMLSKQSPTLAKTQLDKAYKSSQKDLEAIKTLTNPAVRRKLLEEYADGADSSAVHLKAAILPRTSNHVILPVNSLKETEVYAPNFNHGEKVVLIRYPHGGIFEIPELVVNNNNREARKLLPPNQSGHVKDAIGINSKVAQRLSGADFDGDTVLVIPNPAGSGKIKTKPALEELKGFDPQRMYPGYEGMPRMKPETKQIEMGKVSNLITDMTIKGAKDAEIARAVKHSMVVIDAEKHNLNYKQSAIDNGIHQLKVKYQSSPDRGGLGASTIISRKKTTIEVPKRSNTYTIDPATGRKIYRETGSSYVNKKGKTIVEKSKVNWLEDQVDAHALSSGTQIERVYADHSNRMKALANEARREAVNTKTIPYSSSARKVYANEVKSLDAKLNLALRNRPLERQAQLIGNAKLNAKKQANPDMPPAEIKKLKGLLLIEARNRTGAGKQLIDITDREWEAIQAGAITNNKLTTILKNADMERVKKLATPKPQRLMTSTNTARAKSLLAQGKTQAEVANILGVSLTTLKTAIE